MSGGKQPLIPDSSRVVFADLPSTSSKPKSVKTVLHVEQGRSILHESQLHEVIKRSKSEKRLRLEVKRQRIKAKLLDRQAIVRSVKSCGSRLFPFIGHMRRYRWAEHFPKDVVSGLSVGMMIIPQAIAYSSLARLQPQYGFYSAFFAMLLYFFFGTSRHINLSTGGVIALLIGNVLLTKAWRPDCSGNSTTLSPPTNSTFLLDADEEMEIQPYLQGCVDPELAARYAVTLTLLSGIFQLIFGCLRLGVLSIFLSDPLVNAFTCGAALHILESQIPAMLGMTSVKRNSGVGQFLMNLESLVENIRDVNGATIGITVVCVLILVGGRKINSKIIKYTVVPIPFDILVLILTLVASYVGNWETSLQVKVVGDIQRGFMPPSLPQLNLFKEVWLDSLIISILAYSLVISVSKSYAVKYGYEVDANQEMVASGVVNTVLGFFNGFVATVSMGCTALHDCLDGKSQVFGLVASAVTLVGILGVGPYFRWVPQCALSAVILVNLSGTVLQVTSFVTLWEINKFDWVIWLVTLVAVVGLNVDVGLGVGLIFSLVTVIYRTHSAAAYLLGRLPGTDVYRNTERNASAQEIPGVKIFKFEGSLYFGSAENFRRALYQKTKLNPKKMFRKQEKLLALKMLERADNEQPPTDTGGTQQQQQTYVNEGLELEEISGAIIAATNVGIISQEMRKLREDDAVIEQSNQRGVFTLQEPRLEEDVVGGGAVQPHPMPPIQEDQQVGISNPEPSAEVPVRFIVLDMSACAFIDSVGVRVLTQIIQDYHKVNIQFLLANVAGYVRKMLTNADFQKKVPNSQHSFVTVHDAVLSALHSIMGDYLQLEEEASIMEDFRQRRLSISGQVFPEPANIDEVRAVGDDNGDMQALDVAPQTTNRFTSARPSLFTVSSEVSKGLGDREHLLETIRQLQHHNRLLRRMLDKKENDLPLLEKYREQGCQTEISALSDSDEVSARSYIKSGKRDSRPQLKTIHDPNKRPSLLSSAWHKVVVRPHSSEDKKPLRVRSSTYTAPLPSTLWDTGVATSAATEQHHNTPVQSDMHPRGSVTFSEDRAASSVVVDAVVDARQNMP